MNYLKFQPLFNRLLPLCAMAWICGCGEAPPTPTLPGHREVAADRVLLDDEIDASDIREIFAALNQDGRLKSIAPWVEQTSAADLTAIGKVFTRYFYQSAHDPEGAVALLKERTRNGSFSKALEFAKEWASSSSAQPMAGLAKSAMKSPFFMEVVERDIGFLSPELDASLAELQSEFEKAWECVGECSVPETVPATQVVKDLNRFLSTSGLKHRWVELCGSLADSWPIVGFLHGLREVNQRHGGRAFDGMGDGLSKMIREPRDPSKGQLPTQFDSLMDLMLALNGPSDGLFSSIHTKLSTNKDLVRELGSILQPNLPGRMLNYAPIIPNTHFGLLVSNLEAKDETGFSRTDWMALAGDPTSEATQQALLKFFISSRSAHETLTGVPRDPGTEDYLIFNLPLYLNNYVLAEWVRQAVTQNQAALKGLSEKEFAEAIWDLPIQTKAFEFDFTSFDPRGEMVFSVDKMDLLSTIGLTDFVGTLTKNNPSGLGGFRYGAPAFSKVPLKEAMRTVIESFDDTRGFADGSALLRSAISFLIRPGASGKSFLQGLETDDLLLSVHRMLNSMPGESWKTIRSVLFDGLAVESLPQESKDILLGFYEGNPHLARRFSRILDSASMLKKLDSGNNGGVSAFEAYHEIVRETGPREWKALSEAWVFIADSGLFALDSVGDAIAPRFPSAYARLSQGDASGLLRLAAQVQPARHRPLADFFNEALREKLGLLGSEVHWDFLRELVSDSPEGMAALWGTYRTGNWSGSRSTLTPSERAWVVEFVREGAFRDLWRVFGDRFLEGAPSEWTKRLQKLSQDGSLKSAFRLLSLVKNDRMREIASALQEWESSGEMMAFLETLDAMWGKPVVATRE